MNRLFNNRIWFFGAVALGCGIWAGVFCSHRIRLILLALCLPCFVAVFFFFRKQAFTTFLLLLLLVFGCLFSSFRYGSIPYQSRWGATVTVTGTVCEAPVFRDGRCIALLKDAAVTDGDTTQTLPWRVKLTVTGGTFPSYGDTISCKGSLKLLDQPQNAGESNFLLSGLADKTAYRIFAGSCQISGENGNPIYGFFVSLRQSLCDKINTSVSGKDEAGVLCAMVAGEQNSASSVAEVFSQNGVSHLLSVSGLHLGLLLLFLRFVFSLLPKLRKTVYIPVMLLFIAGYCALTAFSPPVLRAALMASLVLLADLTGKRYDALNTLGLAALLLLLVNPFRLFDLSFELSFAACFGLVLFAGPPLCKNRIAGYFEGILRSSTGAILATLALTVLVFGTVPLSTMLANLVMIPLSTAALALSFLFLALSYVFLPVLWLMKIPYFCIYLMLRLGAVLSSLPRLTDLHIQPAVVILTLLLLLVCSRFFLPNGKWKAAVATLLVVCILGTGLTLLPKKNQLTVTVLAADNTQCVLLRMPDGTAILVGTGKSDENGGSCETVILPFLEKNVTHLNGLIQTDFSEDGTTALKAFQTGTVLPDVYYQSDASDSGGYQDGTRYSFGGAVLLFRIKKTSLDLYLTYQGKTVLIAGDTAEKPETGCDVLIAPAYGRQAKAEAAFFTAVSPSFMILPCGDYSTIGLRNALSFSQGKTVYQTSTSGMVTCVITQKGIRVSPFHK